MKDFAKSIRVGNGYNGSENLTQSEYEATQKVLKKWEAEKKSAEETVKKYEKMLADNPTASGWKAILEGAKSRIKEADSNIDQLKKELGNRKVGNAESMIEKEIKIIYEANGKDREKAKEYIAKKYPSIARTGQLDRILDEVAGVPARSKNESIDKQEWSMFNGLRKDAEKEIGNRSIRTEKKGDWVVVYINSWKAGAGKAEYKGETLGWQTDGHTYGMTPSGMKNATAFRKTYRSSPSDKQIAEDLIQDFWIHQNNKETMAKVGNAFATAPKEISIGDNVETLTGKKGNVVEKNGHILKIKLSDGSFEYEHEYKAKKVGNATGDEYNSEIQRLTKKAEQLRRMGQGRQAMEIEKQIEKLGKELRELGNKKAGNTQYGSKEDIISHLDTDLYEIHQRLKQKDESPWRYLSELQKKGYDMGTLSRHNKDIGKIIEKLKTGNETKAEEKFGKVMGEYEEGALKTPQGKTVTDPAQAKAIAYSEADKVDNLKRARNAMNKKK